MHFYTEAHSCVLSSTSFFSTVVFGPSCVHDRQRQTIIFVCFNNTEFDKPPKFEKFPRYYR